MADAVRDDTTRIPFLDYCLDRATKLRIDDPVAGMAEAERWALERVHRGELEILWYDAEGQQHMGLPSGWFPHGARYDRYLDAVIEPLPGGRRLYQPQVRDRRHKVDK